MKFNTKGLVLALLFFIGGNTMLSAKKVERTKDYTYNIPCESNVKFSIQAYSSKVKIMNWDKNEVGIVATLKVEAKDAEVLETFFTKANFEPFSGANEVRIAKPFGIEKERTNHGPLGKVTKVTFKDGEKLKIIKYEVSYVIHLPKQARLNVRNSYKDVEVADVSGESVFELFSCDLKAGKLGKTSLSLKYGSAEIAGMKEGKIKLFEGNLDLNSARELNINSRYSRVTIGKADKIELSSFEGKISIGELDHLTANIKYGTLSLDKVRLVELTAAFELDAVIKTMDQGKIADSKYSRYDLGTAGDIDLQKSFEDRLSVSTINRLRANSKYGKFKISELKQDLIIKGFEVDAELLKVDKNFTSIFVDGKYMDLDFDMPQAANYEFEAKVKYPHFKYDASNFEISNIKESGESIEVKMRKKGQKQGAPISRMSITGYEVDLVLREL